MNTSLHPLKMLLLIDLKIIDMIRTVYILFFFKIVMTLDIDTYISYSYILFFSIVLLILETDNYINMIVVILQITIYDLCP